MTKLLAPVDFIRQQKNIVEVSVPANTVVCKSGDQCQHLIILLEGRVRVYRPSEDGRIITLYHIQAGEACILTTSCILNQTSFPAIAETEEDTRGLVIPAKTVLRWLETTPVWQRYIFALLSHRMADLIGLVNALAFTNLDSRLANWLIQHTPSTTITTTHQTIADDLASSREVISRLLKKFERNSLITLGRRVITIENHNELKKIAVM
ncbi:MAG TPA: Crp/Fnr family transcriptional regulator [Thiotrichaceae bacterium]|nr:Crp/Fnr family transcriptional regulator [Thiotrichaceae bacterium]